MPFSLGQEALANNHWEQQQQCGSQPYRQTPSFTQSMVTNSRLNECIFTQSIQRNLSLAGIYLVPCLR
jgi:hypothetical protein